MVLRSPVGVKEEGILEGTIEKSRVYHGFRPPFIIHNTKSVLVRHRLATTWQESATEKIVRRRDV